MTLLTDIDEANATIASLNAKIEKLQAQLEHLQRHLFGVRREKINSAQLRLWEEGKTQLEALMKEAELAAQPKPAKKPGHGRAPFPPELPRETTELDVSDGQRCCPECGEAMHCIGVEATERGHIVPARMVVKRYERRKYACKHGHAVKVAELPDGVVDRGKFEASVYAHVATSKYGDHLPLNRIQGIFKRHGVHFPRQTMWDLMVRLDQLVAQPVLREMHRQLLEEDVLQADETNIRVQQEGERGTRRGVLWAWRNVRGSPKEKVLVKFKHDRSAKGPDSFLGDWTGTLLTDGYDGVNPVSVRNGIDRAGCWSHARRKFRDALSSNKRLAAAAIRPIQRLFWIERAVVARAKRDAIRDGVDLTLERLASFRLKIRQRRSRVVLKQLYDRVFAMDEDAGLQSDSPLGKAVKYAINQREPLLALLRNGKIPIHNNDTERDLRHIVTGRKNWLIFGSQRGGEVAGRLYSLVMSCKLAGIAPEAYLEDALSLVGTTPASRIAELTPWGWAAHQAELASQQA